MTSTQFILVVEDDPVLKNLLGHTFAGRYQTLYANDGNDAWAPGHATFDIGIEREWRAGSTVLVGFARIDNVFDRRAIGSVIVNDGNGRYFEPSPGRGFTVGFRIDAPK